MRYFEYKDEKSDKFWQIEVQGCDVITCYGKIGSAGRESTKSHDSEEKAQASAEKLIAQKVKKGYVESVNNTSATSTAQKTMPNPVKEKTNKKPKKEALTEAKEITQTIEKPNKPLTDKDFCAKPSESLVWDSKFDNQLPVMRGVHVPESAEVKLTTLDKKIKEKLSGDMLAFVEKVHELKVQKTPPLSNQLVDLSNDIHQHFLKLLCCSDWDKKTTYKKLLVWCLQSCTYDLGLKKTLTLFLDAFKVYNQDENSYFVDEIASAGSMYLRVEVANSDDTLYDELEILAQQYYGTMYQLSLVVSCIFAHRQDWANQLKVEWALEEVRKHVFYKPKKFLESASMSYDTVYNKQLFLMPMKLYGLEFNGILDALFEKLTSIKKYEKPLSDFLAMLPMLDSEQTLMTLAKQRV